MKLTLPDTAEASVYGSQRTLGRQDAVWRPRAKILRSEEMQALVMIYSVSSTKLIITLPSEHQKPNTSTRLSRADHMLRLRDRMTKPPRHPRAGSSKLTWLRSLEDQATRHRIREHL